MNSRYVFFGGKGGVGKTTCSTAAAIRAADAGERVLIVSTDPAHSLGDALAVKLSAQAKRIPGITLWAAELDADRALERWMRERKQGLATIAEHGTYLDTDDIEQLLKLSMPGVDEIVGLVELRRLAAAGTYDRIVVDTAPTGHTLRLLTMPDTMRRIAEVFDTMQSKHRFLASSIGGRYRDDAGDTLIDEIDREGRELLEMLRDPGAASFSWVLLPEMLSVEETKDGVAALAAAGITVGEIIVNRIATAFQGCALCVTRAAAERDAIEAVRAAFPGIAISGVAELPTEPRGVAQFRRASRALRPSPLAASRRARAARVVSKPEKKTPASSATIPPWLDVLAPRGCRLLMFGGKGGVGKSTCAAATAIRLARVDAKHKVLLLSTDPAHSLADVLAGDAFADMQEMNAQSLLDARRAGYKDSVNELFDALKGNSRFDVTYDRAVALDLIDLTPPGLDEIFGILKVSEALDAYDLVVLDTAPTGHALRLLEMPATAQAWVRTLLSILLKYRKVTGLGGFAQDLLDMSKQMRELVELLHDPARTRVVAVTRPAELPRLETARFLARLAKLKIRVSAVLVNSVTLPACVRCRRAAKMEAREITKLARGTKKILAPAVAPPPRGVDALLDWSGLWK